MQEIRPILKPKKELREIIKDYITLTWGFDKIWEKLILIIMAIWSVYALYRIFWIGCGC